MLALSIKHILLREHLNSKELAKQLKISQKELADIMEQKKFPDIYTFALLSNLYYIQLKDIVYDTCVPLYNISYIRKNNEDNIIAALRFLPEDIIEQMLSMILHHYNTFKTTVEPYSHIITD